MKNIERTGQRKRSGLRALAMIGFFDPDQSRRREVSNQLRMRHLREHRGLVRIQNHVLR